MTCIWNGNLHGWIVDRSNKHHQKQFLNLNHWIQNPKSREHNEHTWFVVRLRIGPGTASLQEMTVGNWKTIATWSCNQNMCTPRLALKEQKIFAFEEMHVQKACAATSKDMHHWLGSTGSNPSSPNWNSFMPMPSVTPMYWETVNL